MELMLEYPGLTATAFVGLVTVVVVVTIVLRRRSLDARGLGTEVLELADPDEDLASPESSSISMEVVEVADTENAERVVSSESATLFETLAQTLPDVTILHTDKIFFANSAAADLFGVARATLTGKPVTDLMRPAYRALVRKQLLSRLEGDGSSETVEVQLINSEEQGLWAELHSTLVDFDGQQALLTVARDISHRKSMEASLGRGKLQARITLESIGEGVITTDTNGIIDYMNEAAEKLTAATRTLGIGKRLTDLIALVDENDREPLGDPVQQCLNERRRVSLGRRGLMLTKQGERECSIELTASPIRSADGTVAGCVIIFHDVSEIRGLTRRMSYQARHDALTGLVNRAEFERRLESALKSARGTDIGHVVCYLDLDRFKTVNDHHGHSVGDQVIKAVAERLSDLLQQDETIIRMGGDEFLILSTRRTDADSLSALADRIVYDITLPIPIKGAVDRTVGASVGVSVQANGPDLEYELLRTADEAMYQAKKTGRNRSCLHSSVPLSIPQNAS